MNAQEFNDRVKSQVKLTIPITITAFTKGEGMTAVGQVLKKLGEALRLECGGDIEGWYTWDEAWVTEATVGDIKTPQVLPTVKMVVPEEAEVPE
jgi:hypothetical protein